MFMRRGVDPTIGADKAVNSFDDPQVVTTGRNPYPISIRGNRVDTWAQFQANAANCVAIPATFGRIFSDAVRWIATSAFIHSTLDMTLIWGVPIWYGLATYSFLFVLLILCFWSLWSNRSEHFAPSFLWRVFLIALSTFVV